MTDNISTKEVVQEVEMLNAQKVVVDLKSSEMMMKANEEDKLGEGYRELVKSDDIIVG